MYAVNKEDYDDYDDMMDVGNEDTGVVGVASASDRSGEHVPVETIRLSNTG